MNKSIKIYSNHFRPNSHNHCGNDCIKQCELNHSLISYHHCIIFSPELLVLDFIFFCQFLSLFTCSTDKDIYFCFDHCQCFVLNFRINIVFLNRNQYLSLPYTFFSTRKFKFLRLIIMLNLCYFLISLFLNGFYLCFCFFLGLLCLILESCILLLQFLVLFQYEIALAQFLDSLVLRYDNLASLLNFAL